MLPTTDGGRNGGGDTIMVPAPPPPAGPGGIPVPVPSGPAFAAVVRGATRVLEAAAESLALQLANVGDEAATALQDFAQAGTRLGQTLQDAAVGDLDALAALVGDQLVPDLHGALSAVLEVAVPDMSGHAAALSGLIASGSATVDLAAALAPPLEWAHGTVETISRLLEAMTLGL
jgi:hypothetical protein